MTRSSIILALALLGPGSAQCLPGAQAGIPSFSIRNDALTLRNAATSQRFIAAHGRRGMVVGYAGETLEGWIYPFRIFHDYQVSFRLNGSSETIRAKATEVVVNPESVTRIYSAPGYTVRETVFVPLDVGGFLILYQAECTKPLQIVLSFRPDLDLMWPGGIGGQSYGWDTQRRAFILTEASEKYSALVGSPDATWHSSPTSYAKPWQADRTLSFQLSIPANSGSRFFPVVAALTAPPYYDGRKTWDDLGSHAASLYREAVDHYSKVAATGVQLDTPDAHTNLAYNWARIALDQAYVCNPWLGCGLVAGYGPSRDTRRPQYAWFFGGDALDNTWALEASGNHALARDAVRFIQKYQKKDNGEIFHELSQSAGLIDWFKDYPYAYRHTDVSAMYLVAMRNIYRNSGDIEFLRSSWESIKSAYQYLVSRIDPADGLVTIPSGGWGGDETINQPVAKDVYLESVWVAGAGALEDLAGLMGDRELAREARERAEKARKSLATRFWDPQRDFFNYGFNGRGEVLKQELNQPAWGIWLGSFNAEMSERTLEQMAAPRWETAWGTRSVPSNDPLYEAESYGHGSVWPLGTGVQALAFYRYHRRTNAEPLVQALINESFMNSPGHVPEVFSGDANRELDVSVPEQIWSSGMVITTLLRGMLGLDPDAPMSELRWTPHLPRGWAGVTIRNLTIGRSTINLQLKQSRDGISLDIENRGPPVAFTFDPEIPAGIRNASAKLNGRALDVEVRSTATDTHARVKFDAGPRTHIEISFESGPG